MDLTKISVYWMVFESELFYGRQTAGFGVEEGHVVQIYGLRADKSELISDFMVL